MLLRLKEDQFWLALADSDVLLWAKGVAVHAVVDVEIGEPDVSPLQVQGPKSKDVVRTLFGPEVAELRYYWCTETDLDGIPVVVSRTGWTGEIGYEIYLRDWSRGDELWERVMDAGRPFDIRPTAPCEARRIEAGIFNYRSDMTIENNPYEVTGMERLVELDGGTDFLGRRALERIKAEGVGRKLVGIELGGDALPFELSQYWPVDRNGRRVGHVTDAIWSPRLERNIGYAWVPIELSVVGTELVVEMPEGTTAARVASLPFIDPRKDIPKS